MFKNIANQKVTNEVAKKVLGCMTEAIRRLLDGGLGIKDFQIIIDDTDARNRLINYWKSGMPLISDFKIVTTLFDPASFVGKKWQEIIEERDEISTKLTEVDFAKVKFVNYLKEGESLIRGEEFLRRLKDTDDILLGANAFMGLWLDNQAKKENSVIERFYQEGRIKNWLYFFGTVFLSSDGYRYVLVLCRADDGGWDWYVRWLEHGWDAEHLSAVLSQVP